MHTIIDKYNHNSIKVLKQTLVDHLKKESALFNGELSEMHKYFKSDNINNIRIKCFTAINKKSNWMSLLKKLCLEDLKIHLGPDLMIQSKLNLSIQMPNDKSSVLSLHSDSWSADSPFQTVIWIPLTNVYSTNAMFLFPPDTSLEMLKIYKNSNKLPKKFLKSLNKQFVELNYGQILLFNPAQIHGNVKNLTKHTRISLNIRVKSFFTPEPSSRNPDRKYGTYYKKFNLSENAQFGINYIKNGLLK